MTDQPTNYCIVANAFPHRAGEYRKRAQGCADKKIAANRTAKNLRKLAACPPESRHCIDGQLLAKLNIYDTAGLLHLADVYSDIAKECAASAAAFTKAALQLEKEVAQ